MDIKSASQHIHIRIFIESNHHKLSVIALSDKMFNFLYRTGEPTLMKVREYCAQWSVAQCWSLPLPPHPWTGQLWLGAPDSTSRGTDYKGDNSSSFLHKHVLLKTLLEQIQQEGKWSRLSGLLRTTKLHQKQQNTLLDQRTKCYVHTIINITDFGLNGGLIILQHGISVQFGLFCEFSRRTNQKGDMKL